MMSKKIEQQYVSHFPHDTIRDQQKDAIEFCLSAIKSEKRFIIIEAGTGVGKSAIGYTVAKTCANTLSTKLSDDDRSIESGAWFVTTQKILQDQYTRDFSKLGMRSIKSSSNYQCRFKRANTCADSLKELRVEEQGTQFWNSCTMGCIYKKEKANFLKSSTSITNFPYLLTEANYSGKITRRQLLVIDEAHNTETELSKFIEVSVSENFCLSVLKIPFFGDKTQHKAYMWIRDVYLPKVASHVRHVDSILEKYSGIKSKLKDFVSLSRQIDMLKSHREKLTKFINVYSSENWVFEMISAEGRAKRRFTFKPIDVSPFAEDILFRLGEKVILMSATILNKNAFCQSLGIDLSDAEFISLPSPFPVENRPIMFFPVGSMTQKSIDKTLPRLVEAVKSILEEHKDEKGIIHCIHGDSQITMASGRQKSLRDVRPGEHVLSYDEKSKMFEAQEVTNFLNRGVKSTLTIELEDGRAITCTPDHRFLTRNRGWVEAQNLTCEDDIADLENGGSLENKINYV